MANTNLNKDVNMTNTGTKTQQKLLGQNNTEMNTKINAEDNRLSNKLNLEDVDMEDMEDQCYPNITDFKRSNQQNVPKLIQNESA